MTVSLSVANRPIEDHLADIAVHGIIIRTSGFYAKTTAAVENGSDVVEVAYAPPDCEGFSLWVQYGQDGVAPLVEQVLERIDDTHVRVANPAGVTSAALEAHFFDLADRTALLDALAQVPPTGARLVPQHPFLALIEPVAIGDGSELAPSTVQNIEFVGLGGTGATMANGVHGFTIMYLGQAIVPHVLEFCGPVRASGYGVTVDCAGRADEGMNWSHVLRGTWDDNAILRARKYAVNWLAYSAPAGVYTGSSGLDICQHYVSVVGVAGAIGWKIGSENGWPGLDVATSTLEKCSALVGDCASLSAWQAEAVPGMSAAMELSYVDNLTVRDFFAYGSGQRRAHGVRVKPATDAPWFPCEVDFYNPTLIGGIGYDFSLSQWTPDDNSGSGLGLWALRFGDMTDPTGGKKPAPLPESKLLGGHEGINGFTHTFVILDRHQIELWRDGRIKYGVSALDRHAGAPVVTGVTTPTNLISFTLPAHQLRVFDRTPNANVYKHDRKVTLEIEATIFHTAQVNVPLNVKAYLGSACFFDGDVVLTPSDFSRMTRFVGRVFARNASGATIGGNGELTIYAPGSGGGAKAQAVEHQRGHQKSVLSGATTAQEMVLRVEVTSGNAALTITSLNAMVILE